MGVREPQTEGSIDVLSKLALSADRYVLLVSRMVPEKRHIDLIRAFQEARLDGWKLALVGDLSAEDDYVREVRDEALNAGNVVLAGYRTGDELAGLLSNAGYLYCPLLMKACLSRFLKP